VDIRQLGSWGFDRSYSFLHGCHNHYAWEPQFRENNKEDEVRRIWQRGPNADLQQFLRDFTEGMYTKYHMYSEGEDFITPTRENRFKPSQSTCH